jgi:hypothetical protein
VVLLKALFARDEADVTMGLGLNPRSRIFKTGQSIFESNQKRAPPFHRHALRAAQVHSGGGL